MYPTTTTTTARFSITRSDSPSSKCNEYVNLYSRRRRRRRCFSSSSRFHGWMNMDMESVSHFYTKPRKNEAFVVSLSVRLMLTFSKVTSALRICAILCFSLCAKHIFIIIYHMSLFVTLTDVTSTTNPQLLKHLL